MTTKDALLEFIDIWSNQNNIYSKQCTIKSVDVGKRICVCVPIDGSAEIINVRLEADLAVNSDDVPIASSKKGFFVVPKVNSIVGVTFFDKTNAFINVWTEIDEIYVISDQFTFNDGAFGGLIKIDDLTAKLNDLVTKVDDLYKLLGGDPVGIPLTPWVPVPNDGGAALQTKAATLTGPNNFDKNDYENDKITHG
jgi:hypothetical protein